MQPAADAAKEPEHLHDPPFLKHIPHLWPGAGDNDMVDYNCDGGLSLFDIQGSVEVALSQESFTMETTSPGELG